MTNVPKKPVYYDGSGQLPMLPRHESEATKEEIAVKPQDLQVQQPFIIPYYPYQL